MAFKGIKEQSTGFRHCFQVATDAIVVSGASLTWWDTHKCEEPLREMLDSRYQAVHNAWLPVKSPEVTVSSTSSPGRQGEPNMARQLCPSPVRLLFKGRVDMEKVCAWFMQTTETRSLAIVRRTLCCRKRLQVVLGGQRVRAARKRGQHSTARDATKTKCLQPTVNTAPTSRSYKGQYEKGKRGNTDKIHRFSSKTRFEFKKKRAGSRGGGCNVLQVCHSSSDWLCGKGAHSNPCDRHTHRATPSYTDQQPGDLASSQEINGEGDGAMKAGDQVICQVSGTCHLLSLYGSKNKRVAVDRLHTDSSELDEDTSSLKSTSDTQLTSTRNSQSRDLVMNKAQGKLLLIDPKWRRRVKDCRVVLSREIDGFQTQDWRHKSYLYGKPKPCEPQKPAPKHDKVTPTIIGQGGPTVEGRGVSERYLSLTRSTKSVAPSFLAADVPVREDLPQHLKSPNISRAVSTGRWVEEKGLLVRQGNDLMDAKRRLGCVRECKVILRKIKHLDENRMINGTDAPPSKKSASSKHLGQSLEMAPERKINRKARLRVDLSGAETMSRHGNQWELIAASGQDTRGSNITTQRDFRSTDSKSENVVKRQEPEGATTKEQPTDTFTDIKWRLECFRECKVVLRNIHPLQENHLSSVAAHQRFRKKVA